MCCVCACACGGMHGEGEWGGNAAAGFDGGVRQHRTYHHNFALNFFVMIAPRSSATFAYKFNIKLERIMPRKSESQLVVRMGGKQHQSCCQRTYRLDAGGRCGGEGGLGGGKAGEKGGGEGGVSLEDAGGCSGNHTTLLEPVDRSRTRTPTRPSCCAARGTLASAAGMA